MNKVAVCVMFFIGLLLNTFAIGFEPLPTKAISQTVELGIADRMGYNHQTVIITNNMQEVSKQRAVDSNYHILLTGGEISIGGEIVTVAPRKIDAHATGTVWLEVYLNGYSAKYVVQDSPVSTETKKYFPLYKLANGNLECDYTFAPTIMMYE